MVIIALLFWLRRNFRKEEDPEKAKRPKRDKIENSQNSKSKSKEKKEKKIEIEQKLLNQNKETHVY